MNGKLEQNLDHDHHFKKKCQNLDHYHHFGKVKSVLHANCMRNNSLQPLQSLGDKKKQKMLDMMLHLSIELTGQRHLTTVLKDMGDSTNKKNMV